MRLSRRHFFEAAGIAAAAPALDLAGAQTTSTAAPIDVEKNVVFGKGGSIDLRLDIY
jgi:nitrous oxide reductase